MSKEPKIKATPGRSIKTIVDTDAYYKEYPSWCFSSCDVEQWNITEQGLWNEILPKLKDLERRTWSEILITAKKMNHSINVESLNKTARDRLANQHIEGESLISIRLNGTHRLYGYMQSTAFYILWYDTDHGDNPDCVCRSHKKHT